MYDRLDTPAAGEAASARSFSTAESIFAWFCLLAGYLFCRLFPVTSSPLGSFVFLVLLFAVTCLVLLRRDAVFGTAAWCALGSGLVVGAALIVCAQPFLQRLCFVYAVAAYAFFVYAATGNIRGQALSDHLPIDVFKAAIIMPFCSKGFLFTALFSGRAKRGGKVFAKLLLGAAIAIVPTAVVLSLLSYDRAFSELLSSLFDFDIWDIFSHAVSLLFGIPIGMYLFGMLTADLDREAADILTEEQCAQTAQRCQVASPLTVAAATVPLLMVYAIFFISQWPYFMSGFTGVLPKAFSYASYAREGFFQLCTVAVINLVMILAALLLMHRTKATSWPLKILTTVYSLFTLVLISTAVSKMVMYIDYYGLTQKRVYATWFMIVLALVFVLIAVGRFIPRMKTVLVCTAVCVIMFAGLSLSNVGGFIADYNVDRYLDGSLETVDVAALDDLGDAAVPALCRLYKSYEESDQTAGRHYLKVKQVLSAKADDLQNNDVWSFTIPQRKAVNALREIGMMG